MEVKLKYLSNQSSDNCPVFEVAIVETQRTFLLQKIKKEYLAKKQQHYFNP